MVMDRLSLWRLTAILLLVAAVVAALVLLPIRGMLIAALSWIDGLGGWGPVALAALYLPACLLMLPASPLTVAAGFLFGLGIGTLTASAGSVLGASAAFATGRFFAHDLVQSWVSRSRKLNAINRVVGRQGFRIVFIMRLSPVFPFNVMNYVLALSRIRFRDYVLASWIGMLPGTVVYVYLGTAAKSLAELAAGNLEGGATQKTLFVGGLLATVAVAVYVSRVARRALESEMVAEAHE